MIRLKCGFEHGIDIGAIGSKGGLFFSWKGNSLIWLKSFSYFHINVEVHDNECGDVWRLMLFYGNPDERNRGGSWELLRQLGHDQMIPWVVMGDFNETTNSFEKKVVVLDQNGADEHLFGLVEKKITMSMNDKLLKQFTEEDIGYAVKSMALLKAPGIDSFPVIFFQRSNSDWFSPLRETNTWNKDLICSLLDDDQVIPIFSIPISGARSDDMLVWKHKATGVYSAKSGAARTLTLEGRRQQISYVWVDGALKSVRNMANKDQMVGIQNR
ncbi:hypothetical protein PVK06_043649 [Gossypium arboreum]|uniref:Endonuclease/exonuclease/phosphatase domain-containing protein n=1 Tax=Gossypium arboreum TaxID=29729 RepID=A0ABR0MP14_GOSAR|nr:hypothetical protein PVK06_043649 [Gossypium arboreum]